MPRVTVEVEVSVDGCMGGDRPEFWQHLFQFHSPDVTKYLDDLLFGADALLIGRQTYEGFAQVWPTREGPQAERINAMPKYVASRTLDAPLRWNSTLITGDVADEIRKLKQGPGKSLVQYGIGELTQTMLQHGLVDEICMLVAPFAFGEGLRVFDHMRVAKLELLETRTFSSGFVLLRYRPSPSAA